MCIRDRNELSKPHDILILASSIQVLATEHRFEKWSNFPHERKRLLSLLGDLNSHVLLLSGDRHRGGIYQYGDIVEITASSLNRGIFPSYETDKLLLGETHPQNNYGLIEIEKDKPSDLIEVHNRPNYLSDIVKTLGNS